MTAEVKPTHEQIAIEANRLYQEALRAFPTAEQNWLNAEQGLTIELNRGSQEEN